MIQQITIPKGTAQRDIPGPVYGLRFINAPSGATVEVNANGSVLQVRTLGSMNAPGGKPFDRLRFSNPLAVEDWLIELARHPDMDLSGAIAEPRGALLGRSGTSDVPLKATAQGVLQVSGGMTQLYARDFTALSDFAWTGTRYFQTDGSMGPASDLSYWDVREFYGVLLLAYGAFTGAGTAQVGTDGVTSPIQGTQGFQVIETLKVTQNMLSAVGVRQLLFPGTPEVNSTFKRSDSIMFPYMRFHLSLATAPTALGATFYIRVFGLHS